MSSSESESGSAFVGSTIRGICRVGGAVGFAGTEVEAVEDEEAVLERDEEVASGIRAGGDVRLPTEMRRFSRTSERRRGDVNVGVGAGSALAPGCIFGGEVRNTH